MSRVSNGLLPALIDYYKRLEADPNESVADFGFSREKIHLQAVLELDGSLASLDDIRETSERGKPIPMLLLVPDAGGRSGTGVKPFFCWDNTGYALGRDDKGNAARAGRMFEAFRQLHLSMRDELGDDEGYAALCRFLESWDPAQADALANWTEKVGLNLVFKVRGREGFIHQSEAVLQAWRRRAVAMAESEDSVRGVSLISGKEEAIARLHPMLSGVADANTMGAAIVSFNLDAFNSYGKAQSYNAPVGVRDAFRYATALNRLLADQTRRVRIGDATVVFWTDRAEGKEAEEILAVIFGEEGPRDEFAESGETVTRVRTFLEAARQGWPRDLGGDPDAPFYVLGLSPNASRISVRFWLAATVSQLAERLARHAGDLEMTGARQADSPLVLRRLLLETTREPKGIPPKLAGDVARAVLGGLPYPQTLFSAVLRRIRTDALVNHRRAAILKAYLVRNRQQEVPVALNRDHPEEAYHLGRLFAALEKTQEDATDGQLNSTIKDRYFGAAGATPATIFPRLLRLHQHHMNKLENQGLRVSREKLIGEICGRLRRFPLHLSLEKQGLFYIAYYQQRQAFFSRKDDTAKEAPGD